MEDYLAPLDAHSRDLERPIAEGSRSVPLAGLALTVDRASLQQRKDLLTHVKVDLNYRYVGLPADNTFRIPLNYDFVDQKGGWRIAGAGLRADASLPVWATGPIQVERSEHFLALHRPGLTDPARVMKEAEQARAQLDGKITFPLEPGYLLVIARDEGEYSMMSSAAVAPVSPIAQVETSYEVTPDAIKVLSRQMVVNNTKLHEDGSALETFRHELGHLAVAQFTRPFTPAWVSESAAMYLAGTRPVSIWRQGTRDGKFNGINLQTLTRTSSLGQHDPTKEGASLEYAYSAATAWYLVEAFGAEQYWTFYRSYADVPPAQLYDLLPERTASSEGEAAIESLAVSKTDSSLKQVFGLDTATLDQRVRDWMARQA